MVKVATAWQFERGVKILFARGTAAARWVGTALLFVGFGVWVEPSISLSAPILPSPAAVRAAQSSADPSCDCSKIIKQCASGIRILKQSEKQTPRNETELHWTVRLDSSEPRACSFVSGSVTGAHGAYADRVEGFADSIYTRIVRGGKEISDYQNVTQPGVRIRAGNGAYLSCFVCADRALDDREAKTGEGQISNTNDPVAAMQKQLAERAGALADASAQQAKRLERGAASRLANSTVTSAETYEAIAREQRAALKAQATASLNEQLDTLVQKERERLAASHTASSNALAASGFGGDLEAMCPGLLASLENDKPSTNGGICAASYANLQYFERSAGRLRQCRHPFAQQSLASNSQIMSEIRAVAQSAGCQPM